MLRWCLSKLVVVTWLWAARYNTWLLIKLMLEGVIFFFLFLSPGIFHLTLDTESHNELTARCAASTCLLSRRVLV